jgi:hypothetical protein
MNGEGVARDYAEALTWFRKAAEQGDEQAQYNLGAMYGNGRGVPQDYMRSYFWFSLAASRSSGAENEKFTDARDRAGQKLTRENILDAQRMARKWEESHPRK